MSPIRLLALWLAAVALPAAAQAPTFSVEIVETTGAQSPALHSAAAAQHGGRWVFVTGRTDGIHPITASPESFPAAFAHGAVVVYDPATDTRWTAPLDDLPPDVAASLRVTNAEYLQVGETLYVVGGYGLDASGSFVTFPTLTALALPGLVAAVESGTALAPHVRQTTAPWLAVTGGHLLRDAGRFVLAGGQRFDGRYLSGDQVQVYTDAVRRFSITDDGTTLAVGDFSETVDAARFHRRDGNVAPVVRPDGTEAFAFYGGVFTSATLPYRTPVIVAADGSADERPFEARFGHYTCPTIAMHDAATGAMHTLFLGGMGEFKADDAGAVTRDAFVPFIDDVSVLTLAADGTVSETLLDVRLPALLGTNAQWFDADGVPTTPGGAVRLGALSGRTLVGTMHGGIASATEHPALLFQPSSASARMFDVYVTPGTVASEPGASARALALAPPLPNPTAGTATLALTVGRPTSVRAEALDALGRRVAVLHDGPLAAGAHRLVLDATRLPAGVYVVRATTGAATATQRVVVRH